jgi:hypothetical protein
MKPKSWTLRVIIVLIAVLALSAVAIAQPMLQGPDGEETVSEPLADEAVAGDLAQGFSYQGVLTENGVPVSGNRDMEFKLYDAGSGGNQVGSTMSKNVSISNGQFNVFLGWGRDKIDGKALWLNVRARDHDGHWRDLGRTAIHAAPYAMSLKPGAWVRAQSNVLPYALYLEHKGTGAGLRVKSNSGAAIKAVGTGIIQSSAKSYLWVSGNDLRPKNSTDSTQFEMDLYGGVKVKRGGTPGTKDVMLPVTIPGQLYGQDVKVTGIDVYFKSQGDFDGIGKTVVRRQSKAGSGHMMISDGADRTCTTACSYHLDITSNNVLSDDRGVVYIAFQLFFSSSSSYVDFGGVRLTLEHE